MIRVLHLARVVNRYDFIDTIVRHLPGDTFHMEVLTFEREAPIHPPKYEAVGIPHHVIPVRSLRSYPAYVKAGIKLSKLLRDRHIDILHAHHFWEGLTAAIAKLLHQRIRLILHRHYTEDVIRIGGWKKRVLLGIERLSYSMADALIVPTQMMAEIVAQWHAYLPPVHAIPYGFEFEAPKYKPLSEDERETIRAEYGANAQAVVVVNVGTHRLQKGQRDLVQVFQAVEQELPHLRLWLVGEGPDTPFLQRACAQIKEKVRFFGWRSGTEVRQLMGAADIVVHPTYSEAFPQVMIEALALERALIITEVSGVKGILEHQEHAWIIPRGDTRALYEGLRRLAQDPPLRFSLGSKGRDFILKHFHYRQINPNYESLYQHLCSR
ncbi:MAG: glycosyltransferase family 4 protein [Bacteroidia bacterium]|nr:glycosyltransferase family 4 protein [Bacteroidia bacterium]MDW8015403.1 glycosyltransferase family 4 protein [Bacteroidia bacterium]